MICAGLLSGGGFDVHGVTEGLKLGDEAAGFLLGVDAVGEVVGAEFLIGATGVQHVPDDDDQFVGDDDDRFLFGLRAAEAAELADVPAVEVRGTRLVVQLICSRRFEPWSCELRDLIGGCPERFELRGADVTEVAVAAFDVVEVVDVVGHRGGQLDGGGPFAGVEQLDLHPCPERLHRGVIETVAHGPQ